MGVYPEAVWGPDQSITLPSTATLAENQNASNYSVAPYVPYLPAAGLRYGNNAPVVDAAGDILAPGAGVVISAAGDAALRSVTAKQTITVQAPVRNAQVVATPSSA